MKHGTEYAKQVKRLFQEMIKKYGKPPVPEPLEPLDSLVIGLLSVNTSPAKAAQAYQKLREQLVDLNELRVTPAMELAETLSKWLPMAQQKAQCLVAALNAIRKRQDTLDLSFLKQRGRREAREYLESLEGVDRSVAARVVLYSLGGHAIPVDDLTLYLLRKEEIVDPDADLVEVQNFLERHINASDACVFTELLGKWVTEKGSRVSLEKLPTLAPPAPSSPPPEPAAVKPEPAPPAGSGASGKSSMSTEAAKKTASPKKGEKAASKAAAEKPASKTTEKPAGKQEKGKKSSKASGARKASA